MCHVPGAYFYQYFHHTLGKTRQWRREHENCVQKQMSTPRIGVFLSDKAPGQAGQSVPTQGCTETTTWSIMELSLGETCQHSDGNRVPHDCLCLSLPAVVNHCIFPLRLRGMSRHSSNALHPGFTKTNYNLKVFQKVRGEM